MVASDAASPTACCTSAGQVARGYDVAIEVELYGIAQTGRQRFSQNRGSLGVHRGRRLIATKVEVNGLHGISREMLPRPRMRLGIALAGQGHRER